MNYPAGFHSDGARYFYQGNPYIYPNRLMLR